MLLDETNADIERCNEERDQQRRQPTCQRIEPGERPCSDDDDDDDNDVNESMDHFDSMAGHSQLQPHRLVTPVAAAVAYVSCIS